jgi:murein DD-endopeptidase MepM/ murein hydrolase activator NlpD
VMGTGSFIWPTGTSKLSGNDYFSGHLGVDIAAGEGTPVSAADSGVVTWAAPIAGGYGNMVMIDHGNGYVTVYAHLSSFLTHCGAGVTKGQPIAYSGNTGNSTGPHLHFEVRYFGGFINPHFVLPAS